MYVAIFLWHQQQFLTCGCGEAQHVLSNRNCNKIILSDCGAYVLAHKFRRRGLACDLNSVLQSFSHVHHMRHMRRGENHPAPSLLVFLSVVFHVSKLNSSLFKENPRKMRRLQRSHRTIVTGISAFVWGGNRLSPFYPSPQHLIKTFYLQSRPPPRICSFSPMGMKKNT